MFRPPAPAPDGPPLAHRPLLPTLVPGPPHTSAPRLYPASSHTWCTSAVCALTGSVHREGWGGPGLPGSAVTLQSLVLTGEPHGDGEGCRGC